MLGQKEFKIFIVMGLMCLLAGIQGRSVSQIGDIRIDIDDGKFQCDKIECPPETSLCLVTKEKPAPDSTTLIRKNTCYGSNQEVLNSQVTNETINANSNVNVHLEVTSDGNMQISNSYNSYNSFSSSWPSKFDEDVFNREMAKLGNSMQKLGNDLGNMFANL